MKKLIIFSLFLAVVMSACYDDYTTDFEFTAAYFAYQYPVRTVIIDAEAENFEIEVGAVYGGRYAYEGYSENIKFSIEDSLITNDSTAIAMGIKVMPQAWYTLSSESEINIVDSNAGTVKVTINQDSLTAYPDATMNTYALPFVMTSASTDSILAEKNFTIVVVKFKNEFDGRYYVKGVDYALNSQGVPTDTMMYNNDALVLNKYIFLNTISADELLVPRIGNNESESEYVYNMKVRKSDGKAIISGIGTSAISELTGAAEYDYNAKAFISKYNYKDAGIEHSVIDTLIYANTEINMEFWK